MTVVVWRAVESDGLERCRIVEADDVRVEAVVDTGQLRLSYRLRADAAWRFREVTVRTVERTVHVALSGSGWTVDGGERPDLDGALEVDLAFTPFSNTLPVRRLALEVGDSADIVTAYISAELSVVADPQRYTRTSSHEYLYESRDSAFRRVITVDDQGLVTDYPGLFVRD